MSDAQAVEFQLLMSDSDASADKLRAVLKAVAVELERQGAEVTAVMTQSSGDGGRIAKGAGGSGDGALSVKAVAEKLPGIGKWLYERLQGTSTKAKFKNGDVEFEFNGRNVQEMQVAMDEFRLFLAESDAAKRG